MPFLPWNSTWILCQPPTPEKRPIKTCRVGKRSLNQFLFIFYSVDHHEPYQSSHTHTHTHKEYWKRLCETCFVVRLGVLKIEGSSSFGKANMTLFFYGKGTQQRKKETTEKDAMKTPRSQTQETGENMQWQHHNIEHRKQVKHAMKTPQSRTQETGENMQWQHINLKHRKQVKICNDNTTISNTAREFGNHSRIWISRRRWARLLFNLSSHQRGPIWIDTHTTTKCTHENPKLQLWWNSTDRETPRNTKVVCIKPVLQ